MYTIPTMVYTIALMGSVNHRLNVTNEILSRPHITRFLPYDAWDRIRYETTGKYTGSCHLTEIGTLAINPITLHD